MVVLLYIAALSSKPTHSLNKRALPNKIWHQLTNKTALPN